MLECVMIQCTVGSGYSDKWMGHCGTLFLYSLMFRNRGKENAKVNLTSKENRSLLEQPEHKAPILLMTEGERNHLVVEGWFEVLTEYHANPAYPSVDSVLLKEISSHYPY